MTGALSILSPDGGMATDQFAVASASSTFLGATESAPKVSPFGMRGAWLLQTGYTLSSRICDPTLDQKMQRCDLENAKVIILLLSLISTIAFVICAFAFFREDKEEQITPLCPQLVVKDSELNFLLPLFNVHAGLPDSMEVSDNEGNLVVKVSMDWPDPFRQGGTPHGVAGTVRLQDNRNLTLATVVARNVAVVGQGLALCRQGCEIFGFVEPDGDHRYHVRHKTGLHLLTLAGNFEHFDLDGINPVGSKVCSIEKMADGRCVGKVMQHVDAGLVISALMAAHIHRRLTFPGASPWASSTGPPTLQQSGSGNSPAATGGDTGTTVRSQPAPVDSPGETPRWPPRDEPPHTPD